jgi:hypothetical protein
MKKRNTKKEFSFTKHLQLVDDKSLHNQHKALGQPQIAVNFKQL